MTDVVFVDTAFVVALVDVRDHRHLAALALSAALDARGARLLTTDAVLIEVGNFFAKKLRGRAIGFIDSIRHNQGWEVVPNDSQLLSLAEARYRRYSDKFWSLTDCISMEVMRARKVHDVATTDHGFEQAGFRLLLQSKG